MKRSAVLFVLTLGACHPLPDLGPQTAPAGPPPVLLPLDQILSAPLPTATADSAAALAARGAAIKADALAQP
ncbi:MAG: hypothetical protein CFE34_01685 [Rhodobacteraceae bacterium PARR1]|nr:MAG: hypothetical protein CFE34_01685 [Rhodobacteraceae bacterium PARR1]